MISFEVWQKCYKDGRMDASRCLFIWVGGASKRWCSGPVMLWIESGCWGQNTFLLGARIVAAWRSGRVSRVYTLKLVRDTAIVIRHDTRCPVRVGPLLKEKENMKHNACGTNIVVLLGARSKREDGEGQVELVSCLILSPSLCARLTIVLRDDVSCRCSN